MKEANPSSLLTCFLHNIVKQTSYKARCSEYTPRWGIQVLNAIPNDFTNLEFSFADRVCVAMRAFFMNQYDYLHV